MNENLLRQLLTRYYNGETNEQEEAALRKAMCDTALPADLQEEARLFRALQPGEAEVPEGLEARLSAMIDDKAGEGVRFMHRNAPAGRLWHRVAGVAASVVVVVGLAFYLGGQRTPAPKDTFSDPREAGLMLQATLREMSLTFQMGMDQLAGAQEDIARVNREVRNELTIPNID